MCLVRGARRSISLVAAAAVLVAFPLLALARPTALDGKFGKHGLAVAQVGQDGSGANLVAIAPDDGIIAAGMSVFAEGEDSDGDFVVAKFTQQGKLDTSFADNGASIVDIGDDYFFDFPWDLALADDGRILVAGYGSDGDASGASVARLDENGKLDQTLAGDGTLTVDAATLEHASAVLPLPGDAFLLVGPVKKSVGIARFDADGSLDQSFGSGGVALTDVGSAGRVGDAVMTGDGKIVVVAYPSNAPSAYLPGVPKGDFALLRFNADGSLDTTFGDGGAAQGPGSAVSSLTQDSEGDLIASGGRTVARFTPDGKPDESFGKGGVFTFSSASGFAAHGLAIGAKDAVVLSGTAKAHRSKATANHRFAVAVLTRKGVLDRKFANRGFATDKHGDAAKAVTTQGDGKIIAAGRTFGRNIFIGDVAGRETRMMLARYRKP